MALTYDDLVEKYGTGDKIPDAELYTYLDTMRADLAAEMSLGVDRIPQSKLGIEVRRRTKSDLFWLARYFTWDRSPAYSEETSDISYNLIDEEHYRIVCDLFVKKDCTKNILQQDLTTKSRLLLWPRGGMKSTIDQLDIVQWILNFPKIRILMLTAEDSLAVGFVGEVKAFFTIREGMPSLMNMFFPEFCLAENELGAASEFDTPAYERNQRKEPTLLASSVGATKAGKHFELIKADDGVSDKNSESSEQCHTISKKLFLAEKLLVPGGYYIDYIGTRYAEEDHYGQMIEKKIEKTGLAPAKTGRGWTFYETENLKILIGRAIQIKPEVAQALARQDKPVTYQEAGEEGCELLIPHMMPFNWLMSEFSKDEKSFEGQLNQNPRPASQVTFDRVMLLKATVPFNEMPVYGPVSQVWDFAFSKKKGRDYSTGCSIMWREEDAKDDKGKLLGYKHTVGYIQEIVRDRFNHRTLAEAVVNLARKYRPFVIGIERAAGSEFLTEPISTAAMRTSIPEVISVCNRIDWFPVDNQKDAKKVRMAALYPPIVEGRMKFANYCMSPNLETLYSEFEKCLTSHHHDDIPDVISHQPRYAPRATQAIMENNETMMSSTDPSWNLMFEEGTDPFGRMGYGPPTPTFQENVEAEMIDDYMEAEAPSGLPSILGAGIWG